MPTSRPSRRDFERLDMSVGEVGDTDIVPDTGSIGCVVILTEDVNRRSASFGDIKDQGESDGSRARGARPSHSLDRSRLH